ncbi:transposable element Tc1 transposase [Trichonephila clavipes]|nr:transposable element Tc1 transposase [Trichonephila clavipes]
MTGQRYIDEVLHPHVRLFRGAVGDKFVFMDDNATCHRTLAVQDCLDSEGIQCLVWPARSPDLNSIENVWDALGRQVAGRNYPSTNKNTLIRALTEEWDKLPQQLLNNFVQRRCNKSNDGCGESNSTVPKNSADEKNCADGAKLCTHETEPSASKGAESARMFCGIMNLPPPPTKFSKYNHILLQAIRETYEHSMAEAVREAVDENDGKGTLLLLLMVAGRSVVFFFEEWLGDSHKC